MEEDKLQEEKQQDEKQQVKETLSEENLNRYSNEELEFLFETVVNSISDNPNAASEEIAYMKQNIEEAKKTGAIDGDPEQILTEHMRDTIRCFRWYYCDFDSYLMFYQLDLDSFKSVLPVFLARNCNSHLLASKVVLVADRISQSAFKKVYGDTLDTEEFDKKRRDYLMKRLLESPEESIKSIQKYTEALGSADKYQALVDEEAELESFIGKFFKR